MGTPIDKSPPGSSCSNCWGPGKPFGTGFTPRYLSLDVSGILIGDDWDSSLPPAPNGIFEIEQTAACMWDSAVGPWRVMVQFAEYSTGIAIQFLPGANAFIAMFPPACSLIIDNELTNKLTEKYYSGAVKITLGFE